MHILKTKHLSYVPACGFTLKQAVRTNKDLFIHVSESELLILAFSQRFTFRTWRQYPTVYRNYFYPQECWCRPHDASHGELRKLKPYLRPGWRVLHLNAPE